MVPTTAIYTFFSLAEYEKQIYERRCKMERKAICYTFLTLLAFSVIPLVAASGDTLSTSSAIASQPVSFSTISENVNPTRKHTEKTIDRFERIIQNAEAIVEGIEETQGHLPTDELRKIIQEMNSIKDGIDANLSRKANMASVIAFKAKMHEFKEKALEMTNEVRLRQ